MHLVDLVILFSTSRIPFGPSLEAPPAHLTSMSVHLSLEGPTFDDDLRDPRLIYDYGLEMSTTIDMSIRDVV